jgi:hypothetical protein
MAKKNPFHSRKQQIPATSHRAIENTNTTQNPHGQKPTIKTKNGPLSPTTALKLEKSPTFSSRRWLFDKIDVRTFKHVVSKEHENGGYASWFVWV